MYVLYRRGKRFWKSDSGVSWADIFYIYAILRWGRWVFEVCSQCCIQTKENRFSDNLMSQPTASLSISIYCIGYNVNRSIYIICKKRIRERERMKQKKTHTRINNIFSSPATKQRKVTTKWVTRCQPLCELRTSPFYFLSTPCLILLLLPCLVCAVCVPAEAPIQFTTPPPDCWKNLSEPLEV